MALAKNEFGLSCHDRVRWLLQNEPDVMSAVAAFARGQRENIIEVAGPAPQRDVDHFLLKKAQVVPLPTVRLTLKMIRGNLTGDLGIRIDCPERDLEEIGRWQLEKLFRAARPKRLFGLTGEHL